MAGKSGKMTENPTISKKIVKKTTPNVAFFLSLEGKSLMLTLDHEADFSAANFFKAEETFSGTNPDSLPPKRWTCLIRLELV